MLNVPDSTVTRSTAGCQWAGKPVVCRKFQAHGESLGVAHLAFDNGDLGPGRKRGHVGPLEVCWFDHLVLVAVTCGRRHQHAQRKRPCTECGMRASPWLFSPFVYWRPRLAEALTRWRQYSGLTAEFSTPRSVLTRCCTRHRPVAPALLRYSLCTGSGIGVFAEFQACGIGSRTRRSSSTIGPSGSANPRPIIVTARASGSMR